MLAKLLLFAAPFLVPAFLSLAFIAPDAAVVGARPGSPSPVGAVRGAAAAVSNGSLAESRSHAAPEAGTARRTAPAPAARARKPPRVRPPEIYE